MPKKLYISWEQLNLDTKQLSQKLESQGPWSKIVAITRGGLVPAAILSRTLNIKQVETVCISSYDDESELQGQLEIIKPLVSDRSDILVVDDLVDTGKTFQAIRENMMPNAHRACVYAKPDGLPMIDTYGLFIDQETWIVFPWEL